MKKHRYVECFHFDNDTIFIGFPTANEYGGISLLTTAFAPITAPSEIVIPGKIVTLSPIHTLLPITTGPFE